MVLESSERGFSREGLSKQHGQHVELGHPRGARGHTKGGGAGASKALRRTRHLPEPGAKETSEEGS